MNHPFIRFPQEIDILITQGTLTTGKPETDNKIFQIIKDEIASRVPPVEMVAETEPEIVETVR